MKLLHWCTLEPTGSSQLAAIRFSAPVRVRSVRVFPKDMTPFEMQPEIISETEPEAFFLEVFFNAQPVGSPDAKQKQKASNVLIPSVIAYAGGAVDFAVDMGNDYATRLMIVKGEFTKVSMAIYGDVVAERPSSPIPYTPTPLPTLEPTPLSSSIDPSNSSDPTVLARQLLQSIPDAPPLSLVIRLMFCLKPSNDDWDLPEFPYLHPDLDEDTLDFDLDRACQMLGRPVADDVSYEVLQEFVDRVSDAIGPKSNDQAYAVAGILSRSASQNPELARLLLDRLDLRAIFDPTTIDEDTLFRLLVASTNPDIARQLAAVNFQDVLLAVQHNAAADAATKSFAAALIVRIRGWEVLTDALWNSQADFETAVELVRAAGMEEPMFGVLLAALVSHNEIFTRLAEKPVLPRSPPHPPVLMQEAGERGQPTHDEFVAFLRTFIGVSCVLAVYAYTDSLPNKKCREKVLGILRVWQGVKGYREILDHLLLLPQMIFRLGAMTENENDEPTRAGIHAEHILLGLTRKPSALISPSLTECILNMEPGLSVISEDKRQDLRALALLADDGLPAALEELLHPIESVLSAQAVRMLRVALAVVWRELGKGLEGEWRTLSTLWAQRGHGLALHLIDTLQAVSLDIQSLFALTAPRHVTQEDVSGLFGLAHEAMRVVQHLVPVYPLPGRQLRAAVRVIADWYVCAEAADARYTRGSDACDAAQRTRVACIELARTLAKPPREAEVFLRTLLQHGTCAGERDPTYHLVQVFSLVDHLLPMPLRMDIDIGEDEDVVWIKQVIPRVLADLTRFLRLLDVDNRAHLIRRLTALDDGMIGIGEWLLLEELKHLRTSLKSIEGPSVHEDLTLFIQYQVASSLRLLDDLLSSSSDEAAHKAIKYLGTDTEPALLLAACFNTMLSCRLTSPSQLSIAETLVSTLDSTLDTTLALSLGLTFLRGTHSSPTPLPLATALKNTLAALRIVPPKSIAADPDTLTAELSATCLALANTDLLTAPEARAALALLSWLVRLARAGLPQLANLNGISRDTLAHLCDALQDALAPAVSSHRGGEPKIKPDPEPDPGDPRTALNAVRRALDAGAEDAPVPPPSTLLPSQLALPLVRLDALMALRPSSSLRHAHGASSATAPGTPKRATPPHAQDVLGLATVSPPTALLRSPAVTGLTKTYNANDFRQLRQLPSARMNTSRMPSKHVDEFESAMASSSPPIHTGPLPNLNLANLPGLPPHPPTQDGFGGPLGPAFNMR